MATLPQSRIRLRKPGSRTARIATRCRATRLRAWQVGRAVENEDDDMMGQPRMSGGGALRAMGAGHRDDSHLLGEVEACAQAVLRVIVCRSTASYSDDDAVRGSTCPTVGQR